MAAAVALKKDLRKKIKTILKDVSDASAATQSMYIAVNRIEARIDIVSYTCHQSFASHTRVQGSSTDKRVSVHAHRRDQHVQHCA